MDETVKAIERVLVEHSIPVFGIGDSSLMENEDQGYRCSDTLSSAKSILCLGMPFPRGIFHSHTRTNETYWRAANVYYRDIDMILMRIARIIEDKGEVAVPVFG